MFTFLLCVGVLWLVVPFAFVVLSFVSYWIEQFAITRNLNMSKRLERMAAAENLSRALQ